MQERIMRTAEGNNPADQFGRILIVDDNQGNVKYLERVLDLSGYTQHQSTTDSRNAVALYEAFKPDVILLDINMPWMNGFQVLEQLSGLCGGDYLSVIMISAQTDASSHMRALDLGVNDFISKPFDASEVLMRIRNMLQIKRLHIQALEHNRELENRVRERTSEIHDLQIELLTRLVRAAEFRDEDTGNHILRIGKYASALAGFAGLSEKVCEDLEHAAMMHDIGKIGIPDEILQKPGPLNDDEWLLMKTHTIKGAHILSGSTHEVIRLGEILALSHHEWWNGSGYPFSLAGEGIPICGRIVAICDVFDALLSVRPYKAAWTMESTIEAFHRKAGIHFDPFLVDLFLDNISIFIDIWRVHLDDAITPES